MYIVIWYQEDEHEIIYEGNSFEKAQEIAEDALEHIGSDGFRVSIYELVKEECK